MPIEKRVQLLHLFAEGAGVRAAARLADVSTNTVTKLQRDLAVALGDAHSRIVGRRQFQQIQADELTGKVSGEGHAYTWIAIHAPTRFVVCWYTGGRTKGDAEAFLWRLKWHAGERVQISTDAFAAYGTQIAEVFGCKARHDILRKNETHTVGRDAVHTSYVERMNRTVREMNGRFARRTSKLSRNRKDHSKSLNITFFFYNFAKIHSTLRVTPAMEAGITDHVWSLEEVVTLLDVPTPAPAVRIAA